MKLTLLDGNVLQFLRAKNTRITWSLLSHYYIVAPIELGFLIGGRFIYLVIDLVCVKTVLRKGRAKECLSKDGTCLNSRLSCQAHRSLRHRPLYTMLSNAGTRNWSNSTTHPRMCMLCTSSSASSRSTTLPTILKPSIINWFTVTSKRMKAKTYFWQLFNAIYRVGH